MRRSSNGKRWAERVMRVVAVVIALAGLRTSADAGPITFNLGGSGGNGAVGNQLSFTSGDLTVYATAWYSSDETNLLKAALGQYSPGLGVCGGTEVSGGCGSPAHTADNSGGDDFVLFLFSAPVDLTSVYVTAYGDTDASYWLGNVAGAPGQQNLLTGQTFVNLAGLGFGPREDSAGSSSNRTVTLNSPLNSYNALLFGGSFSGTDDAFKIGQLTVGDAAPPPVTPVPEPTTFLLLGGGLAALAARRYFARR